MKLNSYKVAFLAVGVGIIGLFQANAQTYPFPQSRSYSYGFMQTVSTTSQASALAQAWYTDWLNSYYQDCGASGQARIVEGSTTYSEGIGYGMLITAYAGDKARFDRLWAYYKANRNSNGLMHWCRTNCSNPAGGCGDNGATDGDLDAAMALLVANCQWPSTTSPHNYTTDAQNLIAAIRDYETFAPCAGLRVLRPGDAFNIAGACNCINISYFAPGYYRAFAQFMPADAALWNKLADDSYTIINNNDNATTGLVSAWTRANGSIPSNSGGSPDFCNYAVSGGGTAADYQFDAARTPWRIATDYLWYGTPAADTWLTRVSDWANGVGVANIVAGYNTNGTPLVSFKNSAFTGAFALAAMANSQAMTNTFFQWWSNNSVTSGSVGTRLDDGPYFQRSLRVLYMLLATGNFWWPCSTAPTCNGPAITPRPTSICGTSNPLNLNAGIDPIASPLRRRIQWFRNGSSISGANARIFNVYSMGVGQRTGTFRVQVDSLDGSGNLVCRLRDSITINSSLPAVNLGVNRNLCTPGFLTLNSNITTAGYSYQWASTTALGSGAFAQLVEIASATGTSLSNVRTRGLYQLTISATGCTPVMDTVSISSNLPTPVDACINVAGSATISISQPGLGTGPYNWYTSETGSTLAPGASTNTTTYTTPTVSNTTTYWVQDMSSQNGRVGLTTVSGAGNNWGVNAGNHMLFSIGSDITVNSFRIPFGQIYSDNSSSTVTVEILDNSGNSFSPARTFTSLGTPVTTGQSNSLVTYSFTGFNIQSAWGTSLRIRVNAYTANAELMWSNGPVNYPLVSNPLGLMTITGRAGGSNANNYMYFHDWNITSGGNPCGRLPVIVRVGGCSNIVLAVQMLPLRAVAKADEVVLSWQTQFLSTHQKAVIERSFDGQNFSYVETIYSNGSFYDNQSTTYTDRPKPLGGEVYYRVVVLENEQIVLTSNVVRVELLPIWEWTLYPNPSQGNELFVEVPVRINTGKLSIVDALGKTTYETVVDNSTENKLKIDISHVPPGAYFVTLAVGNQKQVKKFIRF